MWVRKIWLFDFCEGLACVAGKRQCAKCVMAKNLTAQRAESEGKKIKTFGLACELAVLNVILLFFILVNAQNCQPNFITHNSVKTINFFF